MRKALTATQWAAMRRGLEGEPPTRALFAAIGGVSAAAVTIRSRSEGWNIVEMKSAPARRRYETMVADLRGRSRGGRMGPQEPASRSGPTGRKTGATATNNRTMPKRRRGLARHSAPRRQTLRSRRPAPFCSGSCEGSWPTRSGAAGSTRRKSRRSAP